MRGQRWALLAAAALAAGACGPLTALAPGPLGPAASAEVAGADPGRGPQAIGRYGCGACHVIPGVTGARGAVGPSLAGVGSRAIIAGRLPNTPDNMVRWIENPPALAPGTAMPDLGVTDADARDIAAYLRTLK
jgi:cytochrome c